jgi:hypothetical protein
MLSRQKFFVLESGSDSGKFSVEFQPVVAVTEAQRVADYPLGSFHHVMWNVVDISDVQQTSCSGPK